MLIAVDRDRGPGQKSPGSYAIFDRCRRFDPWFQTVYDKIPGGRGIATALTTRIPARNPIEGLVGLVISGQRAIRIELADDLPSVGQWKTIKRIGRCNCTWRPVGPGSPAPRFTIRSAP